MNFLIGNLQDDDVDNASDGWDDADDIDLSEEEGDGEEEAETEDCSAHVIKKDDNAVQQNGSQDGLHFGSGMFIGRLSRFIDAVTNPDHVEAEGGGEDFDGNDEDGWQEDDILVDEEDDLINQGEDGWDGDDDVDIQEESYMDPSMQNLSHDSIQTSQAVIEPQPSSTQAHDGVASGWKDHMNTSTSSLGTPFQQSTDAVTSQRPENGVSIPEEKEGWNEEKVDWEGRDLDSRSEAAGIPPLPPPRPSPVVPIQSQVSSMTWGSVISGSTTGPRSSELMEQGWEDGVDDLEGLADVIENSQKAAMPSPSLDAHPQPHRSVAAETGEASNSIPSVSFTENNTTVAFNASVVAETEAEGGWDDDDVLLDDVDEADLGSPEPEANDCENPKLVDSVPLPPPPPPAATDTNTTLGGRTDAAIVDLENPSLVDGWGDNAVDDLADEANEDLYGGTVEEIDDTHNSNRIVFDRIPHPSEDARIHTTIDGTCEEDDISRDDTLSMTNSRSYHQQQQQYNISRLSTTSGGEQDNARLVNWTPETPDYVPLKGGDEDGTPIVSTISQAGGSMSVVYESTDANSSLDSVSVRSGMGDSITTASTTNTGGGGGVGTPSISIVPTSSGGTSRGTKPRRMVDFTPRYSRGASADASLLVAGHTSIGESLDSIDEAEEDDDSDDDAVLKEFLVSHPGVSSSSANGETSPSAMPPLAPFEEREDSSNTDDAGPLVNAVPNVPKALRRSVTGASVEVLSDSSESGDLGEDSDVGSIKDDLYGPMVSHTPHTPSLIPENTKSNQEDNDRISTEIGNKQGVEDDTVVGHADKDVEIDIEKDDEMDDESSRGETSTFGVTSDTMGTVTDDNRSLLSGRLPVVDEAEHVVDFVPQVPPHRAADASTVVLMDEASDSSRVSDNVDDGANTNGFGPIVSHTPSIAKDPRSVATSVVTQVSGLARDIKEDDEMDNTTLGFNQIAGSIGQMDELQAQDMEGGHANEGSHIVDMVPPGGRSRFSLDASVRVLIDTDEDSTHVGTINEEVPTDFGPIVDQTPGVSAPRSVAESMLTQRNTDVHNEDDLDGGTWFGASTVGASSVPPGLASSEGDVSEDGWDDDARVLESLSSLVPLNDPMQLPHVVDHVPDQRPSLDPADPSLIVADPSEMSSQVDDFNQDEQNFGPVVDSIPLERVFPPPAVGSTVVEIPSVLNDDLDEIDEQDEQTHDQPQAPSEWEPQLPNPQSGNDDDSTREQLVDLVPPPEQDVPDLVRDASSEMATVDEKSTLPAEDPIEDDYGPVVDQLPNTSQSPVGKPSESSDDDRKPAANQLHVDSVAPIFSIGSKRENDAIEVIDEDEFGPVVDVLPSSSSRASFAASRGESTVDALATVGEVEDDLNTRDGWDADTVDLAEHPSSPRGSTQRPSDDRSYTVTWGDGVYNQATSSMAQGYAPDAEMGSVTRSLDETKFYDPEAAVDCNGWADDSLTFDSSHNIADADTPPSTPRSSIGHQAQLTSECHDCGVSNGVDCPCVTALLKTNGTNENMVGYWKTPDGEAVKIDFQKLLETETTKRILIEKECKALRETVKNLKAARDALLSINESQEDRENEMMSAIAKWQDANKKLSDDVLKFESDCTRLRSLNDVLTNEVDAVNKSMSEIEEDKKQIQSKEMLLVAEVARLNELNEMQSKQSASCEALEEKVRLTQAELESKAGECLELNAQLDRVQQRLNKSEADCFKYAKDLSRISKEHTQAITNLERRLKDHESETDRVRMEKEFCIADIESKYRAEVLLRKQAELDRDAEKTEKNHVAAQHEVAVQKYEQELSQKQRRIDVLHNQISQAEEKITFFSTVNKKQEEATQSLSVISAELANVTTHRDSLGHQLESCKTMISMLESDVTNLKFAMDEKRSEHEKRIDDFQQKISQSEIEISASTAEIERLRKLTQTAENEKAAMQSQLESLQKSYTTLLSSSTSSALDSVKGEANLKKLEIEVQNLRQQLRAESGRLQLSEQERNKMEARLANVMDQAATIARLENDLQDLQQRNITQQDRIESLESNVRDAETSLAQKDHSIQVLREENKLMEREIAALQTERRELSAKLQAIEAQVINFKDEQSALKKEAAEKTIAVESLKEQVDKIAQERDHYLEERRMFEEENEEMLVQFGLLNEQMNETGQQLEHLMEQLDSKETELRSRDDAVEQAHHKLQISEKKLQTLMRDLDLITSDRNGHADEGERVRLELTRENQLLLGRINEIRVERQTLVSKVDDLETERTSLTETIDQLRSQVSEIESASEARQQKLESIIDALKAENAAYFEKSTAQTMEFVAAGGTMLADVGNQLSFQEISRLQQTDGDVQDLRNRVEDEEAALNLLELQTVCDATQQDLARTQEQLKSAELTTEQLTCKINELSGYESMRKMLEARLTQLEQDLASSRKEESRYRTETFDLRRQIASLEMELRDSSRTYEQSAKEPSGQSSAEIETLRQQIEALMRNQLESSCQTGAREEMIEREVHTLQEQMREKDGQITNLQNELQLLGRDLSNSHNELASKKAHVKKLSSELETLRSKLTERTPFRLLEQTQEEAESLENMRLHIISLAEALETSENRRADVIERIEKERQANADSLRRMTESVKRFYSTLHFGEN